MAVLALLSVAIVALVGGSVTPNAACHFLGSRHARIVSTCNEGLCVDLGRDPNGAFGHVDSGLPVVTCDAAMRSVHELLGEQPREALDELSSDPAREILEFLRNSILIDLNLLSLGLNTARTDFTDSLGVLDSWMLRITARDWQRWETEGVPRVVASAEWQSLRDVYERVLRTSITSSWVHAAHRDGLNAAIGFYFDFLAFMGRHMVSRSVVRHMREVVAHTKPVHRLPDFREQEAPGSAGVPTSAQGLVGLSQCIEGLTRGSESKTERLRFALKGWKDRSVSAAQAMIGQQIRGSLCPVLPRVVSNFRDQLNRMDHVTLGVTLIDMCRSHLALAQLRDARQTLARLAYTGDSSVVREGRDLDFLYNDALPWGLGMSAPNASPAELREIVMNVMDDFLASRIPLSSERAARAFGRAIGLAVLQEVDISHIPIRASMVRLLHPRVRMELESFAELRALLGDFPLACFAALATGVNEVLTPGGQWMFSNDEWTALFVPGYGGVVGDFEEVFYT